MVTKRQGACVKGARLRQGSLGLFVKTTETSKRREGAFEAVIVIGWQGVRVEFSVVVGIFHRWCPDSIIIKDNKWSKSLHTMKILAPNFPTPRTSPTIHSLDTRPPSGWVLATPCRSRGPKPYWSKLLSRRACDLIFQQAIYHHNAFLILTVIPSLQSLFLSGFVQNLFVPIYFLHSVDDPKAHSLPSQAITDDYFKWP